MKMLYKNRKRRNLFVCAKGYWLMPTQINAEEDRKKTKEKINILIKCLKSMKGRNCTM